MIKFTKKSIDRIRGSIAKRGIYNTLLIARMKLGKNIYGNTEQINILNSDDKYKDKYISQIIKIPKKSELFVELDENQIFLNKKDPKIFAYYLPQFYPFEENDAWWGKGTTEWNNVCRAVPQYLDHYQPRLPGELGFYDLRLKENIVRQVELAKHYGVYGFCYYYYWFDGKRLLDKPLDLLLENKDIDFPFFICWANENWTRKFDGTNDAILMKQSQNTDSYQEAIHSMIKYFTDSRYYTIDNKKVLVIYRPSLIPEVKTVVAYWRDEMKKLNTNLYIIAVRENMVTYNWLSVGFDATSEFHPGTLYNHCKQINHELAIVNPAFQGQVFDYKYIVENKKYFENKEVKLYRSIMPMWDNSARRDDKGMIFDNSTPKLYRQWLMDIIHETVTNKALDDKLIFVNAWNEWGEGAYLEPDRRYGYAYLAATKEAILNSRSRE